MRLTIGYPDPSAERRILLESVSNEDAVADVTPVLDAERVLALQNAVDRVRADDSIVDYLMAIIDATRTHPRLRVGASPRASIGLFRAARAAALVDGRTYLVPDDVSSLAAVCLSHRVLPHGMSAASAEAHEEAAGVIADILARVPVPV